MRRYLILLAGIALSASLGLAQLTSTAPYRVIKTAKVGGDGGFDYVVADVVGRRLYIPRHGKNARITVFNLDTLESVGEIPHTSANGVALDPKSGHGFGSSKPVVMWDTKTLAIIKTIDVQGDPDGIMFDPFNERVWIFSHAAPHATVIDAKDGSVVGTIDLGGAPEPGVSDGRGHVYVNIYDKNNVAVVDAKTLQVTAHYDFADEAKTPTGLAIDAKNHILFSACRNAATIRNPTFFGTPEPQTMVILNAGTGKIITTLPIGAGVDGAAFNPATMEAFSSQGDGTLTIVKENSPTTFVVEQTVSTMPSVRTMTLDTKTNNVFLIGAKYSPPYQCCLGGRNMVADSFSILVVGK